jgi:proteasome activator subunit 4
MMFKFSYSFNSATFDDQMLDLLARLSELHANPAVSDPARLSPSYVYTSSPEEELEELYGEAKTETLSLGDNGASSSDGLSDPLDGSWRGIYKDVGILAEDEFKSVVTTALKSMGRSTSIRVRSETRPLLTRPVVRCRRGTEARDWSSL